MTSSSSPEQETVFSPPLRGSCLCGQVRYEVSSLASSQMAHCHCVDCRKFHGAAFSTFAETTTLQWIDGENLLKSFTAPNGSQRQFCSNCGSSLTFRASSSVGTNIMEFALATLDSVHGGFQPDAHVFVDSKVPWYPIRDALPQHVRNRTTVVEEAGVRST